MRQQPHPYNPFELVWLAILPQLSDLLDEVTLRLRRSERVPLVLPIPCGATRVVSFQPPHPSRRVLMWSHGIVGLVVSEAQRDSVFNHVACGVVGARHKVMGFAFCLATDGTAVFPVVANSQTPQFVSRLSQ